DRIPFAAISPASAERQFISACPRKVMSGIKEGRTIVVAMPIVVIRRIRPLRSDAHAAVVTEVVRQRLTQSIGEQILQPLRRALTCAELERIVIADRPRGSATDLSNGCQPCELR